MGRRFSCSSKSNRSLSWKRDTLLVTAQIAISLRVRATSHDHLHLLPLIWCSVELIQNILSHTPLILLQIESALSQMRLQVAKRKGHGGSPHQLGHESLLYFFWLYIFVCEEDGRGRFLLNSCLSSSHFNTNFFSGGFGATQGDSSSGNLWIEEQSYGCARYGKSSYTLCLTKRVAEYF